MVRSSGSVVGWLVLAIGVGCNDYVLETGSSCEVHEEVCDGADNDCDGVVDNDLEATWFADADGDTFGDVNAPVVDCAAPAGFVADHTDCDDGRSDARPGADELCNTLDDDCDGAADEDLGQTWYADADGDGWGDPAAPTGACQAPDGHVDNTLDCDDTDARVPTGDGWCGPADSCLDLLEHGMSTGDGPYTIDPGTGAVDVWCDMTLDGGGWTLLVVASDDGETTWTWDDRALWDTDTRVIGSLAALDRDYKSPVYHQLPFSDLLFVHGPSDVWAAYGSVGDGASAVSDFLGTMGSVCYGEMAGWPMTAGTLTLSGGMCSTDVFFNAIDQDGASTCISHDDGFGPGWSASNNIGCPLDDVGLYGFGPNKLYPSIEADTSFQGFGAGFGWPLGLNTGTPGAGENLIRMYAR